MRNILLIFLLCAVNLLTAQSRKKILSNITQEKNNAYKNHAYKESQEELNSLIFPYFKSKKFTHKTTGKSSPLIFYKDITLSCSGAKRYNNGATQYECLRRLIVSVWYTTNNKSINIEITTEVVNPRTFNPKLYERVLGKPNFSVLELYKYLFLTLNTEGVIFTEQLINQIKTYNKKQKKDKNKIIKGRDY